MKKAMVCVALLAVCVGVYAESKENGRTLNGFENGRTLNGRTLNGRTLNGRTLNGNPTDLASSAKSATEANAGNPLAALARQALAK